MRALALMLLLPAMAQAESLRLATFDGGFSRKGPGLALQALMRGEDPQSEAAIAEIVTADPDVLLLTGIDYDEGQVLLSTLRDRLAAEGVFYGHQFALPPNAGLPMGLDLDGDGTMTEASDAQAFGWFSGMAGMAVLSRYPLELAQDFTAMRWVDLPQGHARNVGLSPAAVEVQRLSTAGHWDLRLLGWDVPLNLFAYAATPPTFDGPERRNHWRNHDETAFWRAYLDGQLPQRYAGGAFVLLGKPNIDLANGDGERAAMQALLADPRVQDPLPQGPHGLATAEYKSINARLRSDYVLVSKELSVDASAVLWNDSEALTHHLVWVELAAQP